MTTVAGAAAGIRDGAFDLLIADAAIGTASLAPLLAIAQHVTGRRLRGATIAEV